MLSLAAAVDPLRAANRHALKPVFTWRFLTPQNRDVVLTSGLSIPAAPIGRVDRLDVLLIVAGFELERQSSAALCASIRRLAAHTQTVAGIDGGSWIMARAGVLAHQRATTHWEDMDRFTRTFPDVAFVDARFVASGQFLTSGGAAPAIDMMLHFIANLHGQPLADRVAGSFIHESDTSADRAQIRQGLPPKLSHAVRRAHIRMWANIEDPLSISQLAADEGVSLRSLQTLFQKDLSVSPQAHYLALRLGEARRLVLDTATPLHDIALATGFTSQSSFARAYRRGYNISASSERRAGQ